jgi:hypothetical protein
MSIPILTTVDNSANTGNVSVLFYKMNATPMQPSQRVTVAQIPASNPAFSRAVQVSSEYVFVKRGTSSFAISLDDLCGIAIGQVPTLSYTPLETLQPKNATVIAGGSNHANFTVLANSETDLTYQWSANNGAAWYSNISNTSNNSGGAYKVYGNTTLAITPASNSPNHYSIVCRIYNAAGNTNSTAVTLTVT